MTQEVKNTAIGSSLEDFLKEEGIYEECHTKTVKEVLVWQLQQIIAANKKPCITRITQTIMQGKTTN